MSNLIKALIWSLIACIISAFNDLITKLVPISAESVVFYRFLISILLISCISIYTKSFQLFFKTKFLLLHVLRGLLLTIAIYFWVLSTKQLPLYIITIVSFLIPIFNLIFALIFLKDIFKVKKVISIALCFIGILISFQFNYFNFKYFFLLLVAAIVFSCLDIINKFCLLKGEGIMSLLFFSNLFSTLFSVFCFKPEILSFNNYLYLIVLGVGANLILYCILQSYKYSEVSSVQHIKYLEFPITILLSYIFFHDKPIMMTLFGSSIIILGNIIACFKE